MSSSAPAAPAAVHLVADDAGALAAARRLADEFRRGAARRDREAAPPAAEVAASLRSGLLGSTVPRAHGGAGIGVSTLAQVLQMVAAADASLGEIHRAHFSFVRRVALERDENRRRERLSRILEGRLLGVGDGDQRPAMGQRSAGDLSPGLSSIAWTEEADAGRADAPAPDAASRAYEDVLRAAVDTGIAQGTLEDAIWFTNHRARPWGEAGVERAGQDPHLIKQFGELAVSFHAAEALLARAALLCDGALAQTGNSQAALDAFLAGAEARVLAETAALQAAAQLFEFGGTRSASTLWNLDRHWRDARTHSLRDPARGGLRTLGDYHLNGIRSSS